MTPRPVLYYGTELPEPRWARLRSGPVVLQHYHALVDGGGFADAFPAAKRYVYLNPTAVPLDHDRLLELPTTSIEPHWGLARLDLSNPVTWRHVVKTALEHLACDEGRTHGLFLDDVDLLLDKIGLNDTLKLVNLMREQAALWWPARRIGLVVNRGFALWCRLEQLDAAVCEELAPCDVDDMSDSARRWIRDSVLPPLRALERRGLPSYALTYASEPKRRPRTEEARELHQLLAATVNSTPHLDIWSDR